MDTRQIGETAAEFMQLLDEQEEGFVGDGATDIALGDIVIIGELFYTDEDGDMICSVVTSSSTTNRIHQSGVVRWGQRLIDDTGSDVMSEEDEDE